MIYVLLFYAFVAQGIEHRFPKPCVAGSNPAEGIMKTLLWQGFLFYFVSKIRLSINRDQLILKKVIETFRIHFVYKYKKTLFPLQEACLGICIYKKKNTSCYTC